jgi:hypothetical protein
MIKRPDLAPLKDTFWNNCFENSLDLKKESKIYIQSFLMNRIAEKISPIRIPVVERFWFYEELY